MASGTLGIRIVTLGAGTSTQIFTPGANLRGVQNIGSNDATLTTVTPAVAGSGWLLPASGGGMSYEDGFRNAVELYAISTNGTTLAVMES